jgi:anhydro-N-acetylmuramic acid kinase
MNTMNVLGIMSGTSLDGVDYAICRISKQSFRLNELWHVRFPSALKERLGLAARDELSSHAVGQLHHDLGRFYAQGCRGRARVDLVGLHGQTIYHAAAKGATFQIGEAAWLVEELGCPVVHNFRVADLAAGGQGAPLATSFHKRIFAQKGQHVCVQNLGGISNVTSLDFRKEEQVVSFDTGPANMLLDLAAKHVTAGRHTFDRDGRLATKGSVNQTLLESWLKHPFFRKPPPKSTGREEFGEVFFRKALGDAESKRCNGVDFIATLTQFIAESIALNYRLHLADAPDRVILSGGGARNRALIAALTWLLRQQNSGISVLSTTELGWPVQAIEAAAFAWLAWLRWNGIPGNLPATTGANRPVLLGQISGHL